MRIKQATQSQASGKNNHTEDTARPEESGECVEGFLCSTYGVKSQHVKRGSHTEHSKS